MVKGETIIDTIDTLQAMQVDYIIVRHGRSGLPAMIARRRGHIAVVASVSGYVGLPGAATDGATKAALNVMCEALYPELERHGVKITIVNPGFVDTPLTEKNDFPMPFLVSSEEAADTIAKGLAKGKFEIIFPWKMALAIRLLHALPHSLRGEVQVERV